jgi:hypothetical protein
MERAIHEVAYGQIPGSIAIPYVTTIERITRFNLPAYNPVVQGRKLLPINFPRFKWMVSSGRIARSRHVDQPFGPGGWIVGFGRKKRS